MNLQTASNFEINKAVAESFGLSTKPQIGNGDLVFVERTDLDIGHEGFDYCGDWADAGPIIFDNGISIEVVESGGRDVWKAEKSIRKGQAIGSFNKNPLRAAMEVYLMLVANQQKQG